MPTMISIVNLSEIFRNKENPLYKKGWCIKKKKNKERNYLISQPTNVQWICIAPVKRLQIYVNVQFRLTVHVKNLAKFQSLSIDLSTFRESMEWKKIGATD